MDGGRHRGQGPRDDFRAAIAAYERPLLLLFPAREDGINDATTIDEVVARHSATAEIVWFPGGGHNLQRTDFDGFLRALLAFLE